MSNRINYEGQVFGNRRIIKNFCDDEDFFKLGLSLPTKESRGNYRLTQCLNCGQVLPANIKNLKKTAPKKCCFCSGIDYKGKTPLCRTNYGDDGETCEIIIPYKDGYLTGYIDTEDKQKVQQYNWRISKKKNKYYIVTGQSKNNSLLYLHNLIMNHNYEKTKKEVDHIDGNSLNNRKANLRIVERITNIQNVKARIDNQIGIRGISKNYNKFRVDFSYNNQRYYFKEWNTLEEAVYCRYCAEKICNLSIIEKNPLAQSLRSLSKEREEEIYLYVLNKILGNQR